MIWGAMLIPVLAAIILALVYSRRLIWWEYLVILLVPAMFIMGMKSLTEFTQTKATEFLGGYIVQAEHHEHWNEWITQTCVRMVSCGTDSEGNTEYCPEAYDCSYCKDHPEYWELIDSNSNGWEVPRSTYDSYIVRWKTPQVFVNQHHSFYTIDGNEFFVHLPEVYSDEMIESTTVPHSYTNKVQASHSVFNFPVIDPKKVSVMERGGINAWHQECILGDAGPTKHAGDITIGKLNGMLGKASKVRVYVLVFKNKPRQSFIDQQAYWKNGHKNELDICVSVDNDYSVQWADVFSWSKEETLKFAIKDHLVGQKTLDLGELGTWLFDQVKGKVIRRDFREFDYLTIDPPMWTIVLTFVLVFVFCAVMGFVFVNMTDFN